MSQTESKSTLRIILSTAPSREVAENIARQLVEGEVAACVNIVPNIRSIYHWEGRVEEADEQLMVCKTSCPQKCQSMLRDLHPYDVPEIVTLEPSEVSKSYLAWVTETCRKD